MAAVKAASSAAPNPLRATSRLFPPAPSQNPDNVDAFADRTNQVLARCVGDVELALAEREQLGHGVSKILHVVLQSVLLLDTRQNHAQRADRADGRAIANRIIPARVSRRKSTRTDRRQRKGRKPEGAPRHPG